MYKRKQTHSSVQSLAEVLDFILLGSTLSLRSCGRLGSVLSVYSQTRRPPKRTREDGGKARELIGKSFFLHVRTLPTLLAKHIFVLDMSMFGIGLANIMSVDPQSIIVNVSVGSVIIDTRIREYNGPLMRRVAATKRHGRADAMTRRTGMTGVP